MNDIPLILGFDTSGPRCAAALLEGDRLLASRIEEMARGQAERLMPMLEEILGDAGVGWRDLAAVGVGTGPGNFTGIRISVAAARGLALSLDIPAIGVSTLEATVHARNLPVLAAVAAPRGQFYVQRFDPDGPGSPELMSLDALRTASTATPICSFDGQALEEVDLDSRHRQPALPLHEAIANIARARFGAGALPSPTPLYIKPADAAPARDAAPVILDDT